MNTLLIVLSICKQDIIANLPNVLQKVEPDLPPEAAHGAHRAKERMKRSSPAGKTLERNARNCSA